MMSWNSKSTSFSENLVLDDSDKGVIITGIKDESIAAKSGLQTGDEIVAATIHLDHLNKNEVLNILKVLEPYDNNMKVLTKKELSGSAGLGSLGLGLNDSAEMLNLTKDLSFDASAKAPVASLDGLSGKLNAAQRLGGELNGPTLNGDLPSLSLNKPSADAGAKFTMPSLGLTGPDVKGDLDGTLKSPNVSVSTPPLNVTKPEIKTGNLKYSSPKFSMPQFDLPQLSPPHASGDIDAPFFGNLETPDLDPKLNLKSSDLDLNGPKLDLNGPKLDLNGPKLDLNGPDVNLGKTDIEPPSGKIKWPHLKWKGAKVNGPDGDINADLSAPGVSLSTPKLDGNLGAPDVNFPKAEIKAPEVDAQMPNVDIDAPSGKINWPHLKWKKPHFHGLKADLDANLNAPDVDLSLPKVEGGINTPDVDLNLPKADLEVPHFDAEAPSGKVNWPHLKWKKPKFQGPKADLDMDANLDTPDVRLSTPKFDGDITVPNAELNVPNNNVDIQAPDVDFDAPSGKINWPHLKWKKPRFHGPKTDMDLNADLNTPNLSVPNVESDISTPDLNLPKADVNIDPPSGKIKFPTLKKPKFMLSGSKMKSPDVDIHADAPGLNLDPDVDFNLPKADIDVNTPDIEAPSGKIKWPTLNLKKPKFGTLKGPKADLDADLSAPDVHLSAPNIGGGLDTPDLDLSLPNADVKGLDVDLNGPDLDTPDGKLKFPTFKLPKLKGPNVKGPELDADLTAPDIEAQNFSLSAPKIEGGLDAVDCDISLPKADLKLPDVDLQAPEADASAGKVKLPKFKLPKFDLSGPRVKGPNIDVDADLRSPDMSLPDVNAKLPEADLTVPDLNLEAPKIKGGIATPDLNLEAPDVAIDAPGKLKMPSLKLPKWNIGGTKAQLPDAELTTPGVSGPDVNVNLPGADVKGPKFNLSAPTIKGDLNAKGDLGLPKADVKVPSLDLRAPDPNLKVPDLSLSSAKIDGNLSAPNIDTNLPEVELKTPDAKLKTPAFDSHVGDFKLPFKFPKFGFSKSEVEVPSVHPSVKAGIDAPKVNIGNITADANMSAPNLETSFNSETDGSGDEIEIPAFRSHKLPRHSIDGSDTIDIFGSSKVTEDRDYVFSKGIRLPIVNSKSAGGEINIMERLKMAMEKVPSTNVTPTEVKTDIDLKLASPSVDASASTEAGDSSLVRGGTFKVEKLESALGALTSDDNDKLSLGLSNMLGLNVKDSDAD